MALRRRLLQHSQRRVQARHPFKMHMQIGTNQKRFQFKCEHEIHWREPDASRALDRHCTHLSNLNVATQGCVCALQIGDTSSSTKRGNSARIGCDSTEARRPSANHIVGTIDIWNSIPLMPSRAAKFSFDRTTVSSRMVNPWALAVHPGAFLHTCLSAELPASASADPPSPDEDPRPPAPNHSAYVPAPLPKHPL